MAHKVTLQPSGHSFEVPEGKSILSAGLDAKLFMPYSCQTGVCRTCRGVVKEGTVDYGMVHPNYLPDSDKAKGYALLCQAKPLSDLTIEVAELEGLEGIEPRMIPGRVAKMELAAPDVMVVKLRLHPNENMRYLPGQYINVQLTDGDTRSYSISDMPSTLSSGSLELHIRHMPGGKYTDHVFSDMKVRDILRFEGPLGTFYLREKSDKPIVMVASGTGFSPIKAICENILDRGIQKERPVSLYWGCREKRDLYMLDLVKGWAAENEGFTFHPILSEPGPDCEWTGRTGFVHETVISDFADMSGVQIYAAGNPAMIDAARSDFVEKCGLPADEFFADSFLTEKERSVNDDASAN